MTTEAPKPVESADMKVDPAPPTADHPTEEKKAEEKKAEEKKAEESPSKQLHRPRKRPLEERRKLRMLKRKTMAVDLTGEDAPETADGWTPGSRVQVVGGQNDGAVGIIVKPGKKDRFIVTFKGLGKITIRKKKLKLADKRLTRHRMDQHDDHTGQKECVCGNWTDQELKKCLCGVEVCEKCRQSQCLLCESYLCRSCERIKSVCSKCKAHCKGCRKYWIICASCRHELCKECGMFTTCTGVCGEEVCYKCADVGCQNCEFEKQNEDDAGKEQSKILPNSLDAMKQPVQPVTIIQKVLLPGDGQIA